MQSVNDPEIDAAFNGSQSSSNPSGVSDPEIAAAFSPKWGDRALGAGELGLTAVGNVLPAAGNAAIDLGSRALGFGTGNNHVIPEFGTGQAGQQLIQDIKGSDAYKKVAAGFNSADQWVGQNLGDTAQDVLHQAGHVAGDVAAILPVTKGATGLLDSGAETAARIEPTLGDVGAHRSAGAAAANYDLSQASPELQAKLQSAQTSGTPINQDALGRHLQAESLPVPVQLTRGQATQDVATLSDEQNARAKTPELATRFNQQNGQLTQNIQAIRDNAGPDVFSTNPVEHGDTLIQAYKDKDAPIVADIQAKYKALEDANGGQFPLDTKAFVSGADTALSKAFKTNSVPPDIAAQLSELRNGRQMTFEDFETLRSDAADAARTATDGRQRAAAGIIRNQLETLPLTPEAAQLKPLADSARAAAKARFDALDADPAYDAAVHGTVPPDQFVQRFVTGNGKTATRDGVATMKSNLADNPQALQTMGVATIDHLRQQAGIDSLGNGNFSQAGFNKALNGLGPKLQHLVQPEQANQLADLGDVARNTQVQPRGSYVNNSNTLTAAMKEHAAGALEGAINLKAGGIPVGTWIRNMRQRSVSAAETQKMLEPGAGITQ